MRLEQLKIEGCPNRLTLYRSLRLGKSVRVYSEELGRHQTNEFGQEKRREEKYVRGYNYSGLGLEIMNL